MSEAADLAAQGCYELEEAWAIARTVWRDGTADHYYRRFHVVAVDTLRDFKRSAEELERSLELAEAAVSRRS